MIKREKLGILLLSMVICAVCAASCANGASIIGKWRNPDRELSFDGQKFEVHFPNSEKVSGFRGSYELDGNEVAMKYQEYLDASGMWRGLEGTDFEGYIEKISVKATTSTLKTFIIANKKTYSYIRQKE